MKTFVHFAGIMMLAAPAFADGHSQGDAAAGEEQFNRQCVACHVVRDDSGEVLAGRSAKVGPNLYAIAGRQTGGIADFRYGDALVELGEMGAIWTEANFAGYVQDPTNWLREKLDDRRARSKMAYRVRSADEALDLYAFLATFGDADAQAAALAAGADNALNQ